MLCSDFPLYGRNLFLHFEKLKGETTQKRKKVFFFKFDMEKVL